MAKRNTGSRPSQQSKKSLESRKHYHDTKHLLKQFRRISYAVQMAEEDLDLRMQFEHGVSMSNLETNAQLAGIDLSDTKIERYTKDMVRSQRMIAIMKAALEWVRKDPDRGDLYYAVLYETYFTPKSFATREDVIDHLNAQGFHMSTSTYYLYLRQSICAFDKVLWRYTARSCLDILASFTPEMNNL